MPGLLVLRPASASPEGLLEMQIPRHIPHRLNQHLHFKIFGRYMCIIQFKKHWTLVYKVFLKVGWSGISQTIVCLLKYRFLPQRFSFCIHCLFYCSMLHSLYGFLRAGIADTSGIQANSYFQSWPEVTHGLYLLELLGDMKDPSPTKICSLESLAAASLCFWGNCLIGKKVHLSWVIQGRSHGSLNQFLQPTPLPTLPWWTTEKRN